MNCMYCGSVLAESAKFCEKCGKPVMTAPEPEAFAEPTDRESSIAYFEKARNLFAGFTPYFELIIDYTIKRDHITRAGKHHPDRGFWIAGGIMTVSSFFALAFNLEGGLPVLAFGVALLIIAIIMKTVVAKIQDKKSEASTQKQLFDMDAKIDSLYNQIQVLYSQNDFLLRHYPRQYFSEHAISSCLNYLYTGRADSKKEALNLYEQELHQMRMEEAQQNILNVQQDILDTALRTEAEARATKKAAVATAVMTGIQLNTTRRIAKNVNEIKEKLD